MKFFFKNFWLTIVALLGVVAAWLTIKSLAIVVGVIIFALLVGLIQPIRVFLSTAKRNREIYQHIESLGVKAAYSVQLLADDDIYSLLQQSTEVRILAVSLAHKIGVDRFINIISSRLQDRKTTKVILMSPQPDMKEELRLREIADRYLVPKENIISASNTIRSIANSAKMNIDQVLRFYRHYPPCSIYMGDDVAFVTIYILESGSGGFTLKLHKQGGYFARIRSHFDLIWDDQGTRNVSEIFRENEVGELVLKTS